MLLHQQKLPISDFEGFFLAIHGKIGKNKIFLQELSYLGTRIPPAPKFRKL
jgi:hypothetical protein